MNVHIPLKPALLEHALTHIFVGLRANLARGKNQSDISCPLIVMGRYFIKALFL